MRKIYIVLTLAMPFVGNATTWQDSTQNSPPAPVYDSRLSPDMPPTVTPTPGAHPDNNSDLNITQAVRRGIYSDTTLPHSSKNISVMTARGQVTLRGIVGSPGEKAKIEAIVKGVPGVRAVDNLITYPDAPR